MKKKIPSIEITSGIGVTDDKKAVEFMQRYIERHPEVLTPKVTNINQQSYKTSILNVRNKKK